MHAVFLWLYNDMTQNFCQFPWTTLLVDIDADKWRWCTKVPQRLGFSEHYPISKDRDSVKQDFLEGKKPPQCSACWREEDLGFLSHRIKENGNIVPGYNLGLRFLDVSLSKHCEMSCATCGPESSSRWRSIYSNSNNPVFKNKVAPLPNVDREQSYSKIINLISENISSLERINLIGGEPTTDPLFYRLVDHLVTLENLPNKTLLRIVTAANHESDAFVNALNKLKEKSYRIRVIVSMDAVGPNQEFIRAGLVWDRFERNLLELASAGHCRDINVVVSVFNVSMVHEIPTWVESHDMLDNIKPNIIFAQDMVSVAVVGGISLYLSPKWLEEHREHELWKDPIKNINRHIRKNRFVPPDQQRVSNVVKYLKWYTNVNKLDVPENIKKFFYLVDLFDRQPLLFGKKLQLGNEQTDPE